MAAMRPTPNQAQLLKLYREQDHAKNHLAHKRRYQRVIGIGLGGAGLAAAIAGMPFMVSVLLWGMGFVSWRILRAV